MDEARRQALIAEREDAMRERELLAAYIEVLNKRLGVQVQEGQPDQVSPTPPGPGPLTSDVLSLVYDQEFHGWTMPKAAAEVLSRWSPPPHHRPLKTAELLDALRKGGITKEYRVLYRSLYTAPRLKLIKGGRWGLAEWYPAERNKNGSSTGRQELFDSLENSGEEDNVSHLPGPTDQPTPKEGAAS